ncbi:MAG: peptidoglycan DD-metalloendopeptidase family protein [bacterium]
MSISPKTAESLTRRIAKSPFIRLSLLIVVLLGITSLKTAESPQEKESFSLTDLSLFAKSVDNMELESPELSLVQGNSVISNSPPLIVTSQVLGSLIGSGVAAEEGRKEIIEYTVQTGDNLWSIADKFDVSLETIRWANDLTANSVIKSGDKLIVPPVSSVLHLVEAGDTLSGIAQKYKGNTVEIIAFSDIGEDGKIFIGDILVIPNGKMPTIAPSYAQVPLADSYLSFPTQGKITQGLHWYNAVDVANKCGTPIYAAAGGSVQKTGYITTGGNRVTILHSNGIVTYYGHLSKIVVSAGQTVSQGQLIGYMGNTGYTVGVTGCHLHFDVLNKGVKNPLAKYQVGDYIGWK